MEIQLVDIPPKPPKLSTERKKKLFGSEGGELFKEREVVVKSKPDPFKEPMFSKKDKIVLGLIGLVGAGALYVIFSRRRKKNRKILPPRVVTYVTPKTIPKAIRKKTPKRKARRTPKRSPRRR